MKSSTARAALAAIAVALAPAGWAQSSDSILSRHVREADGTTGQDTNTGSGIKTNHLQNGAVTGAKLAPAAVGAGAIQDGAVTAAKLAGGIPASKIDRAGLDADSLDGYQAGDFSPIMHNHVPAEIQGLDGYRRKHRHVIVVAKDGSGDFDDPSAAMAATWDASADNTYLVKILPGVYDVPVFVPRAYVDVEGSGQSSTRIRTADWDPGQFRVMMYGPGEVRDLTFEMINSKGAVALDRTLRNVTLVRTATATAHQWSVLAVYRNSALDHVTLRAQSAEGVDSGSGIGLLNTADARVRDSEISMSGGEALTGLQAQYQSAGSTEVERTRIAVVAPVYPMGMHILSGNARVRDSRITAETVGDAPYLSNAVVVSGADNTFDRCEFSARWRGLGVPDFIVNQVGTSVSYSRVEVGSTGGAQARCIGLYDASYNPVGCNPQ